MVHKDLPEARILPVIYGTDRLRMSSRTGRHRHHARRPDACHYHVLRYIGLRYSD